MPLRQRLLLLLLLAVAGCIPSRGVVESVARRSPSAVFSVPASGDSLIAITFDDGPEPGHTDAVLDLLAEHGARGTFFLMGERVKANPTLTRRIADEGHEVANHGWGPMAGILLSESQLRRSIARTDRLLRAFGEPRWYRPSTGFYDGRALRAAEAEGYRIALGSIYSNDPQLTFVGVQARHILREVRSGDVIVLHDGIGDRTKAPEILRRVLPELARRGYRIVPLSELVDASGAEGGSPEAPGEASGDRSRS
ncbi:polysaccharide deacetylase family protein [Rubricoccus marinus]|uniref:NodB homology domain-containing protein n=1 Tax=Rubricoccus marinus TaxID=716817 RepID=A0A259TW52_9BACT|nr:polysaccharide deacetylase family protein [Rubricoccus marinus]OZC01926.1 hypothetical protein BSZ36_02340 [Rubricoccus marinus]